MRVTRLLSLLFWIFYGVMFIHGVRRGYTAAEYWEIRPGFIYGYDPRVLFEAVAGRPSPPGTAPR